MLPALIPRVARRSGPVRPPILTQQSGAVHPRLSDAANTGGQRFLCTRPQAGGSEGSSKSRLVVPAASASALTVALLAVGGGAPDPCFGKPARAEVGNGEAASAARQRRPKERVVVIGGGVMGGSVAWALAGKGVPVTVLDAGYPGSSWGESRICRLAYNDPLYIRMMKRGFQLWDRLAQDTGRTLLRRVPCLDVGDASLTSLAILGRTYAALGMEYEELSPAEVALRYPQIRLRQTERAVLQQDAGVLLASECVAALAEASQEQGADWVYAATVVAIDRAHHVVTTEDGREFPYSQLILCAGPWTNKMLEVARLPLLPLVVTNEQSVYYQVRGRQSGPRHDVEDGMPVVLQHIPRATPSVKRSGLYAVPHVGGIPGVKLGFHRRGPLLHNDDFVLRQDSLSNLTLLPNVIARGVSFAGARSDDLDWDPKAQSDSFVLEHFPGLTTSDAHHIRCLYTQTTLPDEDFLVGSCPADPAVFVAAGFGGEGFKFGVAIGELLAELALGAPLTLPSAEQRFALQRAYVGNLEVGAASTSHVAATIAQAAGQ